jgi:TolA-binding protein
MKAQERHHLKQNEVALTAARVMEFVTLHRDRLLVALGVAVVAGAAAAAYFYIQRSTDDQASAILGAAMAIEGALIVPAPTVPGAVQQAGTYPTEQARDEAALQAYQGVIDAYPTHETGTAARFHRAGLLLEMGRAAEAEQAFAEVTAGAGSSLYASSAKLGHVQALVALNKFDEGIAILTELARVSLKAGKRDDARAAFKRVVDEFPMSLYTAEARERLQTLG